MGVEALTQTADGRIVVPESVDQWVSWVSATATRSYLLDDPLLDWLHLYGSEHGFQRDEELPGYDERTDMRLFLFGKGSAFEAAVVAHLRTLVDVVTICGPGDSVRDLAKAEEMWRAMRDGASVIHQGALRDADAMTQAPLTCSSAATFWPSCSPTASPSPTHVFPRRTSAAPSITVSLTSSSRRST